MSWIHKAVVAMCSGSAVPDVLRDGATPHTVESLYTYEEAWRVRSRAREETAYSQLYARDEYGVIDWD